MYQTNFVPMTNDVTVMMPARINCMFALAAAASEKCCQG
jgi:hypothetical protein